MRRYLVVLMAMVLSSGVACNKGTPSATSEGTPEASAAGRGDTGDATCPDLSGDDPSVIKIQNSAFEPSCLIAAGSSSITVVNMDGVDHTFTIDGTQVDVTVASGETLNGESAGLKPGEYGFRCTIHPGMSGTTTVV